MNTLFISDLHLEEQRPDITAIFFEFLKNEAVDADALYILGDLFEVWIGDDENTELHQVVTANLKTLSKHTPIYFMHGNRDFLIGKKFATASQCKILRDPTVIDLYGTPTLLMHGDTLCTEDKAYLKFRKRVRNWFVQKMFLAKSLAKRKHIADQMRKGSQEHTSQADKKIMDVTPEEIPRVMQKHKVQQLIHGHTHRPCIHHLELNNAQATRFVLSDWHKSGGALVVSTSGDKKLVTLPNLI